MSLPTSFCGDSAASVFVANNVGPCVRETVLDAAVPASVLTLGLIAFAVKQIVNKRKNGRIHLDDDAILSLPADTDAAVDDALRPLLSQQTETKRTKGQYVRLFADFVKFALAVLQTLLVVGLYHHRTQSVPEDQEGPFRYYSLYIQFGAWALVSVITLVRFVSAAAHKSPAGKGIGFLNLFYMVTLLFGVLPRVYDLIFAYTDKAAYFSHEHSRYDNFEAYAVIVNGTISAILASFFIFASKVTSSENLAPSGRQYSPERDASELSRVVFGWLDGLIWQGNKQTHKEEELWELDITDSCASNVRSFRNFSAMNKDKKRGLSTNLVLLFKKDIARQVSWGLVACALTYAGPFFMNRILFFIEHPEGVPTSVPYLYAAGMLGSAAVMAVANSKTQWIAQRVCVQIKSIVLGEVYNKTLKLADLSGQVKKEDDEAEQTATRGLVTNIFNNDADKIAWTANYFNTLYMAPIQILIGAYFLWKLLGWAALIGLGFILLLIPFNTWATGLYDGIQDQLMKATDKRVAVITEVLHGIRIIKYFGWEKNMAKRVEDSRDAEVKLLAKINYFGAFFHAVSYAGPILVTVTTLVFYTKVFGNDLPASIAFTALSLLVALRTQLDMLPATIMFFIQCKVSLNRISKFLNQPELVSKLVKKQTPAQPRSATRIARKHAPSIAPMSVASFSRSVDQPFLGSFESDLLGSSMLGSSVSTSLLGDNHGTYGSINSAPHRLPESISSAGQPLIGFQNASFGWTDGDSSDASGRLFILKNLNVQFPVGQLTLIAGPTGCGKTSMILALLGEMKPFGTEGKTFLPDKHDNRRIDPTTGFTNGIAYVAQQAWLQCASIRDNILFGQPFDKERYEAVIRACALTRDLQILEAGDQTEVGEKGITLSGGQKQRVALARALYSRARHVILDDCLSAVDAHTAKHLFEKCLLGPLMKGRTRILVTHHVALCLRGASRVVVMGDGTIAATGTPEEVAASGALSEEVFRESQVEAAEAAKAAETKTDAPVAEDKKADENKSDGKLIEDEKRGEGTISWKVYHLYMTSGGGILAYIMIVILFALTQLFTLGEDFWLRQWAGAYNNVIETVQTTAINAMSLMPNRYGANPSDVPAYLMSHHVVRPHENETVKVVHRAEVDVNYYVSIYSALAAVVIVSQFVRVLFAFWVSLQSSKSLHSQLLQRIIRAPVRFFDTTPVGRIINRFTQDIGAIDQMLIWMVTMFVENTLTTIGVLAIVSSISPPFIIAAVLIAILYGMMGALYLKTSRDMKRLISVSKSPALTLLDETVVGVTTIRAFGEEKRFIRSNCKRVDGQARPYLWNWAANIWLQVRVDLIGAFVSFFASCLVLSGGLDAGLAGVSLTYALQFTVSCFWVVRSYSLLETNMNSVERVKEYLEIEQEPPAIIENNRPPASWPSAGAIEVDNLVLKYAPDLPPVLRGLTFNIQPGEKVGIVGRTGAGKSTLAVAFFRFIEPADGKIFIDGVDISTLGLEDLRGRMTIIPQDPVLFSGTIRSNLDPFSSHDDADLWAALRRSHLVSETPQDEVTGSETNSGKITSLDAVVSDNGGNFSQGQRQLLALARALVKNSRVIIMDEATASVDFETDAKIQATVAQEFAQSTLLVIAHRLRTVVDYDKIMVLDHGRVVEFGDPYSLMTTKAASPELLAAEDGMKPGLFRSMCERTGNAEYAALLDIAKAKAKARRA